MHITFPYLMEIKYNVRPIRYDESFLPIFQPLSFILLDLFKHLTKVYNNTIT